jgi:hypothetical protein
MRIKIYNTFLFGCLAFCLITGISQISAASVPLTHSLKDSIPERQLLYKGRLWRNLYYQVKGNQFLFTVEFLPGTVTMNGATFNNVNIRYDIFSDELLIPFNRISALRLNQEMVDSFSMSFQGRQYRFARLSDDSLKGVKGYVNVLYSGKCSLYIKHRKEIELLAVDGKYDRFFQTQKIYFVKGGEVFNVSGKIGLMKIMGDQKTAIKGYVRKNKLKMAKNNPESFVPLVRYYDGLMK